MTALRTSRRAAWAFLALALAVMGCAQPGTSGSSLPAALPATLAPPSLPTSTPEPAPSPTPAYPTVVPTHVSPPTASPTAQPAGLALPTPCAGDACVVDFLFPFERPIASPGRDRVDISYRFGSSQNGQRDVHHGVEFLNSHGTPVLAAAPGEVVYAGDDLKIKVGLYYNFYGNFVVLEHKIPGLPEPVYSLYAHLSKIDVQVGDAVNAGEKIGEVGATGAATGSHLHFEVRYGENTYTQSRNPELWMQPVSGEGSQPSGALAGKIVDPDGKQVAIPNIVIERVNGFGEAPQSIFYTSTYEDKELAGLDPWNESFALGDLTPGEYRVSFIYRGSQEKLVQVEAGKLTLVTFDVDY